MIEDSNKIISDKIQELEHLIQEFKEKIENGTDNPEEFITLDRIETEWEALRKNTDYLYSDMLSELISNTNERELIRKKKENTKNVE